ncbi:MAG: hypothetical protein CMD43_05550 [Gammaproteobacteria bacterium]|nr:hypothetical protein [Gammaproteobacteria bacterium]
MLYFYGHNCFLTETKTAILVIDPWFSNKGAFFGSWFQYPDNEIYKEAILEKIQNKKSFIFITHEHQDHYDEETIKEFAHHAKFIIPEYKDHYLENKLKDVGCEIHTISNQEILDISSDLKISAYISDIGVNHDSAILVETNDFTFLNQNDCKIFDVVSNIKIPIDFYSVQFSGASWHPVCYANYSQEEKANISYEKSQVKLKNVLNTIRAIKPKYFLPAAGPAIFPFLDQSLSLGKENIFTHQDKLHAYLTQHDVDNIIYARPGDEILTNKKTYPINPPTEIELANYREKKFNHWESLKYQFDKQSLINEVKSRLNEIIDITIQGAPLVIFSWGTDPHDKIAINLNDKTIVDDIVQPEEYYQISGDKKYFSLMHSGFRWQDVYLSLRAKVTRVPDNFNNLVNAFIFSDTSNIKKSMLSFIDIPNERIKIMGKDGYYEIDRYCPHNSGDLCKADVNENNEVVCPRHGWKFSLSNDGKMKSGAYTINAKKIDE